MELSYDWLISLISGGSIGAAITYIATFKSKRRLAEADAKSAETKVVKDLDQLHKDNFDYLQETLDRYIKEYHNLEQNFRDKMRELRDNIDNLSKENSLIISSKCNEIASLKSEITYLKGIRCYNFLCDKRIKTNPDKPE